MSLRQEAARIVAGSYLPQSSNATSDRLSVIDSDLPEQSSCLSGGFSSSLLEVVSPSSLSQRDDNNWLRMVGTGRAGASFQEMQTPTSSLYRMVHFQKERIWWQWIIGLLPSK